MDSLSHNQFITIIPMIATRTSELRLCPSRRMLHPGISWMPRRLAHVPLGHFMTFLHREALPNLGGVAALAACGLRAACGGWCFQTTLLTELTDVFRKNITFEDRPYALMAMEG